MDEKHLLLVLDNFSIGRPDNLLHQRRNSRIKVVQVDIADREKIIPYFINIDWVFHIAVLADIVLKKSLASK